MQISTSAAVLCALSLLASGCTAAADPVAPPPATPPVTPPPTTPPPTPVTTTPSLTRTVVVSGLSSPWDIAFTSDGTLFYTERCRGLSVRRPDGTTSWLFGSSGASLVAPDRTCDNQSGIMGVALDPAFATNRTIYVYMSSNLSGASNRVVRLQLNAGFTTASNRTDIITDIAYKAVPTDNGGAGSHSGGRIRFGPDGFLYVGTGDNHNGSIPQSPTSLGGKVLRVRGDGTAAPGNNAPSGFNARIYTYGHRNVQGIAFRPGTGQPFTAEHGPNHSDEVTPLVAGGNAGWDPQNRSGLTCPDSYCGYAGSPTSMPMTDLARFPNALRSSWNNNAESHGVGPATFLEGTQWEGWNGRLAVGVMGRRRLDILELDSAGQSTSVTTASLPAERFRSVVQGPDGNLWIATDGGEIWRVTPS